MSPVLGREYTFTLHLQSCYVVSQLGSESHAAALASNVVAFYPAPLEEGTANQENDCIVIVEGGSFTEFNSG